MDSNEVCVYSIRILLANNSVGKATTLALFLPRPLLCQEWFVARSPNVDARFAGQL